MLLQVLTHSREKLGWVQLECCKRTDQQCKLLAMLAFAELQGAALQEVCGCGEVDNKQSWSGRLL